MPAEGSFRRMIWEGDSSWQRATIIYVDAIVVGIADGRWFGMNFVAKNKAPKRQDTYVIAWVSGWYSVVGGGDQLPQPWRNSVQPRTGIGGV